MIIHHAESIEQVNQLFIDYFLNIANNAISKNGVFNWVLTGGNSPKKVYSSIAEEYKNSIDWSKVYFFFGDERYVNPSSDEYNGKMATNSLLEKLEISTNQIFYIPTQTNPEQDAQDYQLKIDAHFGVKNASERENIKFDLIMLGMGDDAHTASLFPFTSALTHTKPEIISVWVEKLNTHRITFTAELINQAHEVAFLCFGKNKSDALKKVWDKDENNIYQYPSKLIQPKQGNLHWFLDNELYESL